MNEDLEDWFCEWVMLWNKDFMDDELHLQLEKESARVLQSVAIQTDQITGLSLNYLLNCLPKTSFLFSFTSGLALSFFIKNTKIWNARIHSSMSLWYGKLHVVLVQRVCCRKFVLSLEICIIYRPPKSCTFKNLWSDASSAVIYGIITVSNISGMPYC